MSNELRVTITTSDGEMPAYFWNGVEPNGTAIVLFQEIFGVTDYIKSRARDLAALGYDVIAPELYWRLDDSTIDETAPDFLQQAMAVVSRLDWQRAVEDGAAAIEHLRSGHCCVALVGFCFGGGLAFNVAAVERADALVSYYGSALPGLLDLTVDIPSLHHFGLSDSYIQPDVVEQIRSSVTAHRDVKFLTYPGAGHAFDNPNPMFYNAEASDKAWAATVAFLTLHPPGRRPPRGEAVRRIAQKLRPPWRRSRFYFGATAEAAEAAWRAGEGL